MSVFGSKKGAKSPRSEMNHLTTSIGEECIFEGSISTSSSTRIDGTLQGKITGENSLVVGERGVVTGEIKALEIIVFGRIEGVIEADRLEIKDTGVVTGDLYVGKLVVQEGGIYNGRCAMGGAAERVLVEASASSGQDELGAPVSADPKAIRTK